MRPPTLEGHNFFVRIPIRVFLDSMESPLSQDSIHIHVEGIGYWSWPVGTIGKDWSGRARGVKLVVHVRPPTSEGHNFFVRIPIRVFLDYMER